MNISPRNTFRIAFKVFLVLSVGFMVGFWVYKFTIEDRDIGIVDYVSMAEAYDIDLPMPYMCFETPVLHNTLQAIESTINASKYLKYLKGEIYDKRFVEVNYEEVTLQLENYFLNAKIILFDGNVMPNKSREFTSNHIFSGVEEGLFLKCFEIKWGHKADDQSKQVKKILLTYNKTKLINDLLDSTKSTFLISIGMHYPGQFLQEIGEKTAAPISNTYAQLLLVTKGIEFLKRRNSHQRKCMEDWKNYDTAILSKDMETKQCRAPYHAIEYNLRKCNSERELRAAQTDFLGVRGKYFSKPCHRISKLDINYHGYSDPSGFGNEFKLIISYPEEIKIITQSKEIDVHALIGNIGSYIGLFLGMKINLSRFNSI